MQGIESQGVVMILSQKEANELIYAIEHVPETSVKAIDDPLTELFETLRELEIP